MSRVKCRLLSLGGGAPVVAGGPVILHEAGGYFDAWLLVLLCVVLVLVLVWCCVSCGAACAGACRYDDRPGRTKGDGWTPDDAINCCNHKRSAFVGTVINATGDARYYHRAA